MQKQYLDSIRKLLNLGAASGNGGYYHHQSKQNQLLAAACVSGVKLCKAATYINVNDFYANIFFNIVQGIVEDLKVSGYEWRT